MKKFVMGFLLFVSATSLFAAMPLRNVRLELKVEPLNLYAPNFVIDILGNGFVYGKPKTRGLRVVAPVLFDRLSLDEMKYIEYLIHQASFGNVVPPAVGMIHCQAMPIEQQTYSADNGTIFVQSAAVPCGGVTTNDSFATPRLIEILNREREKFQNFLN